MSKKFDELVAEALVVERELRTKSADQAQHPRVDFGVPFAGGGWNTWTSRTSRED